MCGGVLELPKQEQNSTKSSQSLLVKIIYSSLLEAERVKSVSNVSFEYIYGKYFLYLIFEVMGMFNAVPLGLFPRV